MLDLYSLDVDVAEGGSIPFNNITIAKGCTAVLSAPATVQLNRSGVYMVTVSGSIEPAAAGDASFQLAKDGTLILGAESIATAAADATVPLGFSTLVQVRDNNTCACNTSPTTLQLVNTGEAGTYSVVRMEITKVC